MEFYSCVSTLLEILARRVAEAEPAPYVVFVSTLLEILGAGGFGNTTERTRGVSTLLEILAEPMDIRVVAKLLHPSFNPS